MIMIPAVALFAILVLGAIKFGNLSVVLALVCAIFGFYVATSGSGPAVGRFLDGLWAYFHGHR